MNITIENIVLAKNELAVGKSLQVIITENNLDSTPTELGEALIKKYGTDTVGNPLLRNRITRRANRAIEEALLELTKAEVVKYLEDKIAEINA